MSLDLFNAGSIPVFFGKVPDPDLLGYEPYGHWGFRWGDDTLPELGTVVQLAIVENSVVVVPSNGLAPLGFVEGIEHNFAGVRKVFEGTSKITISCKRVILETTQYEVEQRYLVNSLLFVKSGKFTTLSNGPEFPAVAMVMVPPTAVNSKLRLLWL